jgi:5'-3' exonuclease
LSAKEPTPIAVAFDCNKPTFRHKVLSVIKANRPAFPDDLVPTAFADKGMCSMRWRFCPD